MPLHEDVPAFLRTTAGAGDADRPIVAVATDITLQGAFGEEWLVVTGDRLRVYVPNGAQPTPRVDLPLAELTAPRAETLVGGGALQATVHGETIDLIHYTNARQRAFSRVAKYLEDVATYHEARAKGEDG